MGGCRKQTASLKFPAKESGVLEKRSVMLEPTVLMRDLTESKQKIREDKAPSSPSQPLSRQS